MMLRNHKNKLAITTLILFYSTMFVTFANAGTATVSWDPNTENDLSGYKIHYGTSTQNYDAVIDVGNVTAHQISNLQGGNTYYFVVTAYDLTGNQSDYSQEVSAFINLGNTDTNAPDLVAVVPVGETQIDILFSEPLDITSAEIASNYSINGIQVLGAIMDPDETTVHLITTKHDRDKNYTLTVSNVQDKAGNVITSGSSKTFILPDPSKDSTPPELIYLVVVDESHLDVIFNEALGLNPAENKNNFSIDNGIQVTQAKLKDNKSIVQLTTTTHQSGVTCNLTVTNVLDLAGNAIQNNNTASYKYESSESKDNTDLIPPYLTSVTAKGGTQIDVSFTEPVSKATSENKNNYSISNNVTILGVVRDVNLTTVHLITASHQSGVEYTLAVQNIEDLSGNKIASNSNYKYTYNSGGTEERTDDPTTPSTFSLDQNYPNPFNPTTEIRFHLSERRKIELNIYNSLGQIIKTLVKGEMEAGLRTVQWDGTNENGNQVPSGIYIYCLEVSRNVQAGDLLVNVSLERRVKRMTLIR